MAPGAANAQLLEQCSGGAITGQGSTLQEFAQNKLWDSSAAPGSGFNVSTSPLACSGTQGSKEKPEVKYTGTGSGPGMKSWYEAENFAPTNAFIGTDQPPNAAVSAKITALGEPETLRTIPLLQASVAIIVHLPVGCTVTGNASGRLELDNTELEDIFAAETTKKVAFTKWSQLGTQNALSGTGCEPTKEFKRVVRLEGSGTTATFQKYLYLVNKAAVDGKVKWLELAEELENTKWPTEATVIRGKGSGGVISELVSNKYCAEEGGCIGYVNLANARGNDALVERGGGGLGTGGKGTRTFWAEVQNNGTGTAKPKYADPANNGDVEAKGSANCEKEVYTNGKVKFPPENTKIPWNEATTKTTETNYAICGFTYDLALSKYSAYKGHGATQGEATSVADYLTWALSDVAGGGQTLLAGNDYLPLPTSTKAADNVLKIAQAGAAEIDY